MALISFKGAGDTYCDIWDSDENNTGLALWGNTDKFDIMVAGELENQRSKGRDTFGQILASVVNPGDATLAITQTQFDRNMMAAQFLGIDSTFTQAATPVEDETFVAIDDKWVPLATRHISVLTVCDDAVPTTTYTLGTDYEANLNLGMIKVLADGAIADGATVFCNYTPLVKAGYEVSGLTKTLLQGNLLFDGKNRVTGKAVQVEIHQAVFAPQGGIDFLSDDWANAELQASLLTPSTQSEPFTVRIIE